ncbi:hypothetical protein SPRA44_620001 [Serratia proteamaculans]|nr:hypothetical protein SPRA44_620001 [Serratia proteamaculans]
MVDAFGIQSGAGIERWFDTYRLATTHAKDWDSVAVSEMLKHQEQGGLGKYGCPVEIGGR